MKKSPNIQQIRIWPISEEFQKIRQALLEAPCSLGVGCEETGICYADAHGSSEQCGKSQKEAGMYLINYNMKEFNERWQDYADNIKFGEALRLGKGQLRTLDPRGYYDWLTEFNIFYTGNLWKPPHLDTDK